MYDLGYQIYTLGNVQGGSSGRGTLFVDIKLKVPPQYELLILKRNSYFKVIATRWTTLYSEGLQDTPGSHLLEHYLVLQPPDPPLELVVLAGEGPPPHCDEGEQGDEGEHEVGAAAHSEINIQLCRVTFLH